MSELIIVSGRSNSPLAEKIARSLGEELSPVTITNFSDGEIWVKNNDQLNLTKLFGLNTKKTLGVKMFLLFNLQILLQKIFLNY